MRRMEVPAAECVSSSGGAVWSRNRRPGASRSLSRWCSRTTSPTGGNVQGGRGRPRRARHAGGGGTPAACRPTPPGAAQGHGFDPERGPGRSDPAVDQNQFKPPGYALPGQVVQHQLAGAVLVGRGRHDQRAHRQPGHIDRDDALGALGSTVGASTVVPPLDDPRARCVSMTTIDGVASARPSASRAAAWSTVSARAQVPLRDHRRNCDQTRVHGADREAAVMCVPVRLSRTHAVP